MSSDFSFRDVAFRKCWREQARDQETVLGSCCSYAEEVWPVLSSPSWGEVEGMEELGEHIQDRLYGGIRRRQAAQPCLIKWKVLQGPEREGEQMACVCSLRDQIQ